MRAPLSPMNHVCSRVGGRALVQEEARPLLEKGKQSLFCVCHKGDLVHSALAIQQSGLPWLPAKSWMGSCFPKYTPFSAYS